MNELKRVQVIVDCAFNEEVCEVRDGEAAMNGPFYLASEVDKELDLRNETMAVLRDQVESLRAELANMKARREQDMHHVESLLKERDEALVKLERANALLERVHSEQAPTVALLCDIGDYLSGTSDTNPRN